MECLDNISWMMSFLKEFNYPLIHGMNFEEMSNVFHISNRCFLVCWALKLLDEGCYLEVLKDREHDKDLLGNLVSQHGFCTVKEKNGFFNGDLPVAVQIQILRRMFICIDRVKKAALIENQKPVTLEDLQTLVNTNLNIFPTFGDIKTLSEKEKLQEIKKLQKEMEELKESSENILVNNECKRNNGYQINKSEFRKTLEKLSENFFHLDRVVKAIKKEKSSEVKRDYKIDPESEELLARCNKYLKIISQYIDNLKTINTFAIVDLPEPDDEISPLIELLAEQIHNRIQNRSV